MSKAPVMPNDIRAYYEVYRVIEINGSQSLYQLAEIITKSFKIYFDHAFGFYSNLENPFKSDESYELFTDMDEPINHAKGVKKEIIADVFCPKKQMLFLFDYGDEWTFLVECIGCSEALVKVKYPKVVEKVGKAPEQYPAYDD